MKYIEKAITTDSDAIANCWPPMCSSIDLTTQAMAVVIPGYASKESKNNGKTAIQSIPVSLDLNDSASFPAWTSLQEQILAWLTTNPASPLQGGTVKDL